MNVLPAINITADALAAEKVRLEVISHNIANANTTRGPDGKVFERKVVSFESTLEQVDGSTGTTLLPSLRVASITNDPTPGALVYNPAHPDADATGMVRMPNVNITREMVDMISASRAFEANLSVVRTSRQMAQQALRIGR